MKTEVKSIVAVNNPEKVEISDENGNLKRKMLLAMLKNHHVSPSPEIVTLLREAVSEIRSYYDSLPRDSDISDEKFNALWGPTIEMLKNNSMDGSLQTTVDILCNAHLELDELIKKFLSRKQPQAESAQAEG